MAERLPKAQVVSVDALGLGHSAEMLSIRLRTDSGDRAVVARLRPAEPGLLEPYDLRRQFELDMSKFHQPAREG